MMDRTLNHVVLQYNKGIYYKGFIKGSFLVPYESNKLYHGWLWLIFHDQHGYSLLPIRWIGHVNLNGGQNRGYLSCTRGFILYPILSNTIPCNMPNGAMFFGIPVNQDSMECFWRIRLPGVLRNALLQHLEENTFSQAVSRLGAAAGWELGWLDVWSVHKSRFVSATPRYTVFVAKYILVQCFLLDCGNDCHDIA